MKIIRESKIDTLDGKELKEPSYEICEVNTLKDINDKEVQIPVAVKVTTEADIKQEILELQAKIEELNTHLITIKEMVLIKPSNKEPVINEE